MQGSNTNTKSIDFEKGIAEYREDGIVYICYKEGTVIDPALQLEMHDMFLQLCDGKKPPFLFSAMDYVTVTKEGRENAKKMEPIFPGSAVAVLADSVAYRLIANFYLKVQRPKVPYRVFNNEELAVNWLKTFL